MAVNMFDKPIEGSFINTYTRLPFREIAAMGAQLDRTRAEAESAYNADLNALKMDAIDYGDLKDTERKKAILSGFESRAQEIPDLYYKDPAKAKAMAKQLGYDIKKARESGEWAAIQSRYDQAQAQKEALRKKYLDPSGKIQDQLLYNERVRQLMEGIQQLDYDPSTGTYGSVGASPDRRYITAEDTRKNLQTGADKINPNAVLTGDNIPDRIGKLNFTDLLRDAGAREYIDYDKVVSVLASQLTDAERSSAEFRSNAYGLGAGGGDPYQRDEEGNVIYEKVPGSKGKTRPKLANNELGRTIGSIAYGTSYRKDKLGNLVKVRDRAAEKAEEKKQEALRTRSPHRTFGIAGGSDDEVIKGSLPEAISDLSFSDDGSLNPKKTVAVKSTGAIGGSGYIKRVIDQEEADRQHGELVKTAQYYGLPVTVEDSSKDIYDKIFKAHKDYSAREITASTLSENAALGYGKEYSRNLSGTKMYLTQKGSLIGDPQHSNGELTDDFAKELGYDKDELLTKMEETLNKVGVSGIISSGVYTGHPYVQIRSEDGESYRNIVLEPDEENKAVNRVAIEASKLRDSHKKGLVPMKNGSVMFINPKIGEDGTFDEDVHMMVPIKPLDVPIESLDTEEKINAYFKKVPGTSVTFEDVLEAAEENFINQGEQYIGRNLWVAPPSKQY